MTSVQKALFWIRALIFSLGFVSMHTLLFTVNLHKIVQLTKLEPFLLSCSPPQWLMLAFWKVFAVTFVLVVNVVVH